MLPTCLERGGRQAEDWLQCIVVNSMVGQDVVSGVAGLFVAVCTFGEDFMFQQHEQQSGQPIKPTESLNHDDASKKITTKSCFLKNFI